MAVDPVLGLGLEGCVLAVEVEEDPVVVEPVVVVGSVVVGSVVVEPVVVEPVVVEPVVVDPVVVESVVVESVVVESVVVEPDVVVDVVAVDGAAVAVVELGFGAYGPRTALSMTAPALPVAPPYQIPPPRRFASGLLGEDVVPAPTTFADVDGAGDDPATVEPASKLAPAASDLVAQRALTGQVSP